ncbi:uncharacterized protein [Nicotiana sylvestris]|uniref:uncharacterized protein n=1 Tax=Nicotiana sylvestris TaxID=4096 RepID=UPI00388C86FB
MSPNELNATSSPWPFATWAMDVIGPIEPTASNGHMFILVAIDYFTKWVEAVSYKVVTKKVITDFVKDHIVCRFGVLESIVTNNAVNLNSDLMKAIWKEDGRSVSRPTLSEQNVQSFQQKGKPRHFAPRQLVLKNIFPHQDEAKGKLSPNWQGPYMVHMVLTGGALILAEMDGEIWSKLINSDAVKRYYALIIYISSSDVIELRLT